MTSFGHAIYKGVQLQGALPLDPNRGSAPGPSLGLRAEPQAPRYRLARAMASEPCQGPALAKNGSVSRLIYRNYSKMRKGDIFLDHSVVACLWCFLAMVDLAVIYLGHLENLYVI